MAYGTEKLRSDQIGPRCSLIVFGGLVKSAISEGMQVSVASG